VAGHEESGSVPWWAVALGACVHWARPRVFSWGATSEEATRPMAGDELCPRPQLNATRAVTIAAPPEDIWPWLVQWGLEPGRLLQL
jgi:hypothetical protein